MSTAPRFLHSSQPRAFRRGTPPGLRKRVFAPGRLLPNARRPGSSAHVRSVRICSAVTTCHPSAGTRAAPLPLQAGQQGPPPEPRGGHAASDIGGLILAALPSTEEAKVPATRARKGQGGDFSLSVSSPTDVAVHTTPNAQRLSSLSRTAVGQPAPVCHVGVWSPPT